MSCGQSAARNVCVDWSADWSACAAACCQPGSDGGVPDALGYKVRQRRHNGLLHVIAHSIIAIVPRFDTESAKLMFVVV